jgi:AraC-like DNA-binding protein
MVFVTGFGTIGLIRSSVHLTPKVASRRMLEMVPVVSQTEHPVRPVGFARAGVARGLARFLAAYRGVDVERLLRHAGITPELLEDPNGLLDFRLWVELGELAAAESGDPAIAATYANQLPWRDLGVFGHVILNSPTLGSALGNACRYFGLQQNVARASLEVRGAEARVTYRIDHPAISTHTQLSEGTLAMFARVCREGLQNPAWTPRAVMFAHGSPRSLEAHTRIFRCPISFDQPVDMLVLSAADLREPMRGADPILLPILLQHADEALAKTSFGDDFSERVARHVISSLNEGEVTIEHIADRIGSSPRTIQRRLREHGLTFKELVARTRLSLSKRYLSDPALTLTEAAFLLGYSELSAFSRAFRRWTGRSAIEFRRDQLRESS